MQDFDTTTLTKVTNLRAIIWNAAINEIERGGLQQLFFGKGFVHNLIYVGNFQGVGMEVNLHSAYLLLIFERGLFTLLVNFIILFLLLVIWFRYCPSKFRHLFVGTWTAYLIALITDGTIFYDLGYLFWFSLVLLFFSGFLDLNVPGENEEKLFLPATAEN